jgi:spermidine synthase
MTPWVTLATVQTAEGPLTLKQRGTTFHIVIGGRVLMTSAERRSEEALATLALTNLPKQPRVLIGGLGMAYTLRAALDVLPGNAQVSVAELTPAVEEWCRGPMAGLTNHAVADKRVKILIGDVSRIIAEAAPGTWDAILLDLYEGPNAATQRRDDPFYGPAALARSRTALTPGGVLSVWSEDPDTAFHKRFVAAGFDVGLHKLGSSRVHSVYLGHKRSP